MNDNTGERLPPEDTEDVNTGEPIRALADFEEVASKGFLDRVRHALERRSLTSQVTSLWWELPKIVLLEFLRLAFGWFGPDDQEKGDAQ